MTDILLGDTGSRVSHIDPDIVTSRHNLVTTLHGSFHPDLIR